jgi:hypothetical protein
MMAVRVILGFVLCAQASLQRDLWPEVLPGIWR